MTDDPISILATANDCNAKAEAIRTSLQKDVAMLETNEAARKADNERKDTTATNGREHRKDTTQS